MTHKDDLTPEPSGEAEIAADDAGASAIAEELQKAADRQGAASVAEAATSDVARSPGQVVKAGEREAAAAAMSSRRQAFAGAAVGVGSVGFDDPGVFTSADALEEGELLIDGQEEVFSRAEIESGRIEHHSGEESARKA